MVRRYVLEREARNWNWSGTNAFGGFSAISLASQLVLLVERGDKDLKERERESLAICDCLLSLVRARISSRMVKAPKIKDDKFYFDPVL